MSLRLLKAGMCRRWSRRFDGVRLLPKRLPVPRRSFEMMGFRVVGFRVHGTGGLLWVGVGVLEIVRGDVKGLVI